MCGLLREHPVDPKSGVRVGVAVQSVLRRTISFCFVNKNKEMWCRKRVRRITTRLVSNRDIVNERPPHDAAPRDRIVHM